MTIITVKTGGIAADAVTDAKIADDIVGTEHLTANEVDTAALKGDAVTGAELADNAVNSEHYTDGSIDTAHLADGQVTIGKLATAVLTGATDIGAAIVDADLFLIDDGAGGTLRKTAASRLKTFITGGITMADNWRINADDATDNAETDLDSGWERVDATGHGTIGSAMTQSSGVFSFPATGLYLVQFQLYQVASGGDGYGQGFIKHMDQANNTTKLSNVVGTHFQNKWLSLYMSTLFDCQNVTNDRVQFFGGSNVNGQVIAGDSGMNRTSATFIRLGDT